MKSLFSPSAHMFLKITGLAALIFLLYFSGEILLSIFPVHLDIKGNGKNIALAIDQSTRKIALPDQFTSIRFVPKESYIREYEIDGSSKIENGVAGSIDTKYFKMISSSPYYQFQAFLRDESSYSTWKNFQITNQQTGLRIINLTESKNIPLPKKYTLSVDLRRIEVPRSIEFTDSADNIYRLTIDRSNKYIRFIQVASSNSPENEMGKWYFPEKEWLPFCAEILYMFIHGIILALLLLLLQTIISIPLPYLKISGFKKLKITIPIFCALIVFSMGICYSVFIFDKAPQIYDGIAYYFQGKMFSHGIIYLPSSLPTENFTLPFFTTHDGKWFSQYAPGTAIFLMLGFLVKMPWIIEPFLAAGATMLIFLLGKNLYGTKAALIAVLLAASSPFIHIQSGSFMSHIPGMFAATCFLYAAVRLDKKLSIRWIALFSISWIMIFFTREIVAFIYMAAVGPYIYIIKIKSNKALLVKCIFTGFLIISVFLMLYFVYNKTLTGNAFKLPRTIFSSSDKLGFGQNIGFYGQHTPGSGLVNTDQLLTSLNITLFGWPFYFTLALVLFPFISGKARGWDFVYGCIVSLFIIMFFLYFAHGIAFGPRYYFEAFPALILLTARGFAILLKRPDSLIHFKKVFATSGQTQLLPILIFSALLSCNFFYFAPRQAYLYKGWNTNPPMPKLGNFIIRDLQGRTSNLHNSLIVIDNRFLFWEHFAVLNCPTFDCDTVFALASNDDEIKMLASKYPGRKVYKIKEESRTLNAVPWPE